MGAVSGTTKLGGCDHPRHTPLRIVSEVCLAFESPPVCRRFGWAIDPDWAREVAERLESAMRSRTIDRPGRVRARHSWRLSLGGSS